MSQKVLEISAEDAKYIDPQQISSIQMVDGTTYLVQDSAQPQEDFVEEAQEEQQYQTQEVQDQQGQKLRGRGLGLAGALAGAAVLGTAAAIGGATLGRRRYGYGYGYGYPYYGYGMGPVIRPMMVPVARPRIIGRPLFYWVKKVRK